MPLKPFELREMTREEREGRDLAIKQAKESEKADAAKKAVKLRPMPAADKRLFKADRHAQLLPHP